MSKPLLARIAVCLALLGACGSLRAAPAGVLMTRDGTSAGIEETYRIAPKFPVAWVQEHYDKGFVIDGLWYLGKTWAVVMKKGLGWAQANRANLASFALEQWEADGYCLTDHAEGEDMTISVLSRIPGTPVQQKRHHKAEWVDTPDEENRHVFRLTFAPFRYAESEAFVALRRTMPGVTKQEIVVRGDPTSFMDKCVNEGMRIMKLQKIGPFYNEWFMVGTRMPGEYAQVWFPMDAAKITEHQKNGYRITCFY